MTSSCVSGRAQGLSGWCLGALALLVAVLGLSGPASAGTPGQIDPGFEAPTVNERIFSVAVQPDGKILIGGVFSYCLGSFSDPPCPENTQRGSVARLNIDGSVDGTFSPPTLFRQVQALAVQPDGKVLIGGNVFPFDSPRQALIRLNADGSIDEGFVDPGLWRPDSPNTGTVESIALQPDGKVLIGGGFTRVGGQADPENVRGGAARLEADGTLDEDFAPPFFGGVVNSVVLQRDGEIPLGGTFSDPGPDRGKHLSRLKADGTLDTSFTSPFSTDFTSVDSLALQPDGKLVFSVQSSSPTVYEVARVLNTSPQTAPTSVSATAGNGQATVSWTAVPGEITEYTATANSGGHSCNTNTPSETSCTVTGLNNGIPYTFTVKAANEFGDGPTSAASDEVTPQGPLTQLTVTKSGTGSGTVTSTPAGIECGSICGAQFAQATSVTLSATAASGSTFTGWGGACSGAGSCEVAMSEARSVTASFAKDSPPVPPVRPTVEVLSAKAKVSKKSVLITSRVKVSVKGRIAQRATTGKGSKARTWCRASRNVSAAGTHTLRCNLGKKGRKALRKGTLRLTLRTTFTPTTGEAVNRDRNLTVKRKR